MNPLIQLKKVTSVFLVAFGLACFGLSPTAQAFLPPPVPDGGYPNDNTAEGFNALFSVTTGSSNTAIGAVALAANTIGHADTANGAGALGSNTTGSANTANGAFALSSNATGNNNTATGFEALFNTGGNNNTAIGFKALFENTTGIDNTGNGANALLHNTTGIANTATGFNALLSNTTGTNNTVNGVDALELNTTGGNNTANGAFALNQNTTGGTNTADGNSALNKNTTGSSNIALGFAAGFNLTTGNNNIDIGNSGVAGEGHTIRIGTIGTQTKTFIAGIHGATASGGAAVFVNSSGQLGTAPSSKRFKDEIKPMDKVSEVILAIKPVTFYYKKEIDPEGVPQFGLVAEEVEKVSPDLVARDGDGKVYTVRYEAVNAMLLNEFLKEHRKMEQQETTIAQLKSAVTALAVTVNEQAAEIQKVSAQFEASKLAPQVVNNNQ